MFTSCPLRMPMRLPAHNCSDSFTDLPRLGFLLPTKAVADILRYRVAQ